MKTKMNIKLLATAGLLTFGLNAQANVVDLFSEPASGQVVSDGTTSGGGVFSEVGAYPNTILGGYRDLFVQKLSGTGSGALDGATHASSLGAEAGFLTFSNASGVTGRGTVQWDGADSSEALDMIGLQDALGQGANLVHQDGCPASGCDRFTFTTYESDLGPWTFLIGLYTDAAHWTEFTLAATPVTIGSPHTSYLLFSDFTNAGTCGQTGGFANAQVLNMTCAAGGQTVDVTDLGAMQLILNTGFGPFGIPTIANLDMTIGAITKTVPEPSTIGLLGMGLLMSGLSRIKRKGLRA